MSLSHDQKIFLMSESVSFLDMIIKKYENKMNKLVESKILEEVKLNEANS